MIFTYFFFFLLGVIGFMLSFKLPLWGRVIIGLSLFIIFSVFFTFIIINIGDYAPDESREVSLEELQLEGKLK